MIELPKNQREDQAPAGLGSIFDQNPHQPAGLVTVSVGPYVERLPIGNSTVGEIRNRFRQRFDIDPRTLAVLDGHEVNNDTVVRTGQILMFVHPSGEKGALQLKAISLTPPRRPRCRSPRTCPSHQPPRKRTHGQN